MDVKFQVDTDPATDLLKVTLAGFMEATDVQALRHRVVEAIGSLRCDRGCHVALWDIRACKIQSQEVVGMFRSMSDERGVSARRIAMVVGGSLMRMQLHRILIDRDLRLFDDPDAAAAWLHHDGIASRRSAPADDGPRRARG